MLIGEVSRRCGVSTRMLRHYDTLGLVQPTGRTSGGYREYSADDLRRLFHVESLRTLGLSLNEAKRAVDEPDFAPAELVGDLIRHTRQRIATEEELLAKLERVDAAAPARWDDVVGLVTLLRALESESGARRQQAILAHGNGALPVEALVAAILSEDDPNVAGALRWSLTRATGLWSVALVDLADGLDSEEVEVRRRAAAALAAIPAAAAEVQLRRVLDDPDALVRVCAALALGARGNPDATPALVEMVVVGQRDVEAAEMLGLLAEQSSADDDIVHVMCHELGQTDDAPTRLRITQALAEIPGTAARRALAQLTHDSDRAVASTATTIMNTQVRGE